MNKAAMKTSMFIRGYIVQQNERLFLCFQEKWMILKLQCAELQSELQNFISPTIFKRKA
jgi:hypothetical protein